MGQAGPGISDWELAVQIINGPGHAGNQVAYGSTPDTTTTHSWYAKRLIRCIDKILQLVTWAETSPYLCNAPIRPNGLSVFMVVLVIVVIVNYIVVGQIVRDEILGRVSRWSFEWSLLPTQSNNQKQVVAWKHNKPRPRVVHRGIMRFLGIDKKCNQVVPWSLHTFPESFMQTGPAVFS